LCGDIPESYRHDSSEEKQYSKYTDAVLSETYKFLGLKSLVLKVRADAADVEVVAKKYTFVADAKAFRLSRTAKNTKDFKVQAMDGWKRGRDYAMVVCPIYQLPTSASQIYQQASSRNVCIFTYSHLAVLVSFSLKAKKASAERLLEKVFRVVPTMNPTKSASSYWIPINNTMLEFSPVIESLWQLEKRAAVESIAAAKEEALTYLAHKREMIMRMSHEEAIKELILVHKLEKRMQDIASVTDNDLLGFC
jgi:type II restriction enzyme